MLDSTRAEYARTMGPNAGLLPGRVVFPVSLPEVQAAVREGARLGQPIYAVSRGCNWGYGEKSPLRANATVLDLSKMNRIVEVDEELAYVVLEPGVSQAQLADHLATHHPRLWMDATGAGGEASVVGNVLERGFGHTPYGDRFRSVCGLEVVLASGEVVRTGFHGYGAGATAHAYSYGVGPALDGLFTQSNFGIVTRMTLWLMPKPEQMAAFFVSFDSAEEMSAGITILTRLKLEGTLRSVVHIGNDLRGIAASERSAGAQGKLSEGARVALRRKYGVTAWTATGAVYGTAAQVAMAVRRLRSTLRRGRVRIITPRLHWWIQRAPFAFRFRAPLAQVMALLQGRVPSASNESVYWSVPRGREADAGLLWLAPICAARASDAARMVTLIEATLAEHDFDPLLSLNYVQERALCAVTQLSFDKANAAQSERARACYHALSRRLLDAGFPPYRVHPLGVTDLHAQNPAVWALARTIKAALDPHALLAPGKNGL